MSCKLLNLLTSHGKTGTRDNFEFPTDFSCKYFLAAIYIYLIYPIYLVSK